MSARGSVIRAARGQMPARVGLTSGYLQHSTPAQLRRLFLGLLIATVVLWVAASAVQRELQSTTGSVRGTASPAYLDAVQARASLSDADRAAWQSFRSGEAQFTGPGQQYQNDITTAGQALQRLAALEAGNSADSSLLQTISGQLVNYQALVEQADDAYQRDVALGTASKNDLGFAYLAYASSSMRDQGGLLGSISQLAVPEQQTLASEMTSPWANPALMLVFVVPALLLIAGVAFAQSLLRQRFNRMLSPPLLLAAALVVALSAWLAVTTLHADSAFSAARTVALPRASALWHSQTLSLIHI